MLSDIFLFNGQQWRIMAFPRGNSGSASSEKTEGDCFSLFLEFHEVHQNLSRPPPTALQVATNTDAGAAVKSRLSVLRDNGEAITKSFCRGFSMRSQHRDWGFKKMCLVSELQADGWALSLW